MALSASAWRVSPAPSSTGFPIRRRPSAPGVASLARAASNQAFANGFADAFVVIAIGLLIAAVLVSGAAAPSRRSR
ncbi:hypothetical protein ACRAWD_31705 [Caulobacter segnis]